MNSFNGGTGLHPLKGPLGADGGKVFRTEVMVVVTLI